MITINLYTTKGCSKCAILRKKCENSPIIANSNFKEFEIDVNNKTDTNLALLIEKGMANFPVLLVDDDFMGFGRAMQYLS